MPRASVPGVGANPSAINGCKAGTELISRSVLSREDWVLGDQVHILNGIEDGVAGKRIVDVSEVLFSFPALLMMDLILVCSQTDVGVEYKTRRTSLWSLVRLSCVSCGFGVADFERHI